MVYKWRDFWGLFKIFFGKGVKKDWKIRKIVICIFKFVDFVFDVYVIEFNEIELWIKELEKFIFLMFVIK